MRKFVWETPDEINMKVAEHAKNLRKRQGITQKRLSELTGVSYASIKRFYFINKDSSRVRCC